MEKVDSIRKLAQAVGRSHAAVESWVRRPDWPFPQRGDWTALVPQIRDWMARTLSPNPATPLATLPPSPSASDPLADLRLSPERMAKVQLLITRRAKLELERLILAGDYINKAEEARRDQDKIYVVKTALSNLTRRLPPLLYGKSLAEMERIIAESMEWICNGFAGKHRHGSSPESQSDPEPDAGD